MAQGDGFVEREVARHAIAAAVLVAPVDRQQRHLRRQACQRRRQRRIRNAVARMVQPHASHIDDIAEPLVLVLRVDGQGFMRRRHRAHAKTGQHLHAVAGVDGDQAPVRHAAALARLVDGGGRHHERQARKTHRQRLQGIGVHMVGMAVRAQHQVEPQQVVGHDGRGHHAPVRKCRARIFARQRVRQIRVEQHPVAGQVDDEAGLAQPVQHHFARRGRGRRVFQPFGQRFAVALDAHLRCHGHSLTAVVAAIDRQGNAGDKGGRRRAQEDHGADDIVRAAPALQRRAFGDARLGHRVFP